MNHEQDNPEAVSKEELLRFLDAGPKVLRWPKKSESGGESCEPKTRGPECPAVESYSELASGKLTGDAAELLLTHAATCLACGDILAWNLNALEGDPSPEEAAAIAELAASRLDWQKTMARELARTSARKRSALRGSVWWTGATIAAVLLLAVGVVVWKQRAHSPDRQLAMAYEQQRTLELRMPEAGYAPLSAGSRVRGGSVNRKPAPLLEAQAQLTRNLETSPQNTRWLQLQARADVLEEHYDAAIDMLDRLLAQGPVTADLLADDASAYYQRGLIGGSELDRSTALDYLRRADELAPDNPVVLFNEAIVMEDRGQMMNAVEVWNRYLTLERNSKWAEEGKRKLAALEKTLSRLKSHQSRIDKMLSSPQAMDVLAKDAPRLAQLDEELATYELDKLLPVAYPAKAGGAESSQQARGSPCAESCLAARRLLQALASSLEIQHHDSWLADLISSDIDSLPAATASLYTQGVRLLVSAIREDNTGVPATARQETQQAQSLFQQILAGRPALPSIARAAEAGKERAELEYLFAVSRDSDYRLCRTEAQLWPRRGATIDDSRYPWIDAVELITEMSCDDTPETRQAGRALLSHALQIAETRDYRLLVARINTRTAIEAQDTGDQEKADEIELPMLRTLSAGDPPTFRILALVTSFPYSEENSFRAHTSESYLREAVQWYELIGSHADAAKVRLELAQAELRIGAMAEADRQLQLAKTEGDAASRGKTSGPNMSEDEISLANLMLERGNLSGASQYLDEAAAYMSGYTDSWGLRTYAAARGQLALAERRLDQAAAALEGEIRASEGRSVRGGDRATVAEYARQDHDLYAELAATWLAQRRSPERILALWERFRMRSRGLPITQCSDGALDCEEPKLIAAQRSLGNNLLIGQIVLLDRVLVYRADHKSVVWVSRPLRRQDVLDASQTLERAVSSPLTSLETAEQLGENLANGVLASLPDHMDSDASLLLETDPLLQNLSWPVLPTSAGALGLRYPLTEMRSILAGPAEGQFAVRASVGSMCKRPLVVGASITGGDEPPLADAIDEAQSVSRLLHSTSPLLGDEATAAHLAQDIGSATIFHFAGHAVQNSNGSELLLAPASEKETTPWIDGAFLRQHPPRACRLAVLSACSTGTRRESWNHPLQDMVETLGDLGVPEIVATRWQIDSKATVPFMDNFYQSLARGESVALALTFARRVQSSQTPYRNPYYWGAYYATGDEPMPIGKELHAKLQEIYPR